MDSEDDWDKPPRLIRLGVAQTFDYGWNRRGALRFSPRRWAYRAVVLRLHALWARPRDIE